MKPFRKTHFLRIVSDFDLDRGPLDLYLSRYFRKYRAIGSKDRKEIASNVYTFFRHKNHFPSGEAFLMGEQIASQEPHEKVSFPKSLYTLIRASHGKGVDNICKILNEQAPITIRTNFSKIEREGLIEKLSKKYDVQPTLDAPHGITISERADLFSSLEFQSGYFEMQDEASQLAANLVDTRPGEHVLDYCSGSGGKALAIAPKLEGKGQIYLHDIRSKALQEAKKRLKRAGIQNGQCLEAESKPLNRLKGNMDWVFVDAPCTGTGTYRRNPEQKWKFTQSMLDELVKKQQMIFELALQYMKPKGHIIYATCSILNEENQEQIAYFCTQYGLEVVGEPLALLPQSRGMDGFFAVKMRRKS